MAPRERTLPGTSFKHKRVFLEGLLGFWGTEEQVQPGVWDPWTRVGVLWALSKTLPCLYSYVTTLFLSGSDWLSLLFSPPGPWHPRLT